MKKILLVAAAASMACSSALAIKPQVIENFSIYRFSPNGQLAVGYMNGVTSVLDLNTNKMEYYADESQYYAPGNGNCVSNNTMLVGMENLLYAAWWKDWTWYQFPDIDSRYSIAEGITADGSRIVGAVAPETYNNDFEGLMLQPCYWDVTDGKAGNTILLPCPELDLTGRIPQSIIAHCISADGKTIAGQVTDYSGKIIQPIVFNMDAQGNWTYTLLLDDLYHPEGINLPEWPGEAPETNPIDYMSDSARRAYLEAYNEWGENGYNEEEWPDPEDYMTEAQIQEWKKAIENADVNYDEYLKFDQEFQKLYKLVPSFDFNNVFLSTDGRLYATTNLKSYEEESTATPYVFNLKDNTYKKYTSNSVNLILTAMADNGVLLAQEPASPNNFDAMAYILPNGEEIFTPI